MKKAQGLPMSTIIIIILVVLVLVAVAIIFFSSVIEGRTGIETGTTEAGEGMDIFQDVAEFPHCFTSNPDGRSSKSCASFCGGDRSHCASTTISVTCSSVGCKHPCYQDTSSCDINCNTPSGAGYTCGDRCGGTATCHQCVAIGGGWGHPLCDRIKTQANCELAGCTWGTE